MSLKDKITEDMKTAMRAKDKERLSTLRMVKSEFMKKEKEGGNSGEITDDEVIKMLNTLVKQRRDSVEQYEKGGRMELAEKENAEITILEEYLPKAASAEEIEKAVAEAIAETDASSMKDMGAVMKTSLEKLSGKTVDGKLVSETVKSKLQ
jgi:uncharacterized protein YqeY